MAYENLLTLTGDADQNAKNLARAQYQDYVSRYIPVENILLKNVGTGDAKSTIDRAKGLAAGAFDVSTAAKQRFNSRYGLRTLSDVSRLDKLAKAALVSKVGYDTAKQVRDESLSRLGQMVALGKGLSTQSGDTLMAAAQNEAQRKQAAAQIEAQQEAARAQTIGNIATSAIMLAAGVI